MITSIYEFQFIWFCFTVHIEFLTKFRFAKISRNWLRNDFRVLREWGTSFASFAVSRNCWDYERNEFRKTRKSRKWRKLEVKIQNLTIFLLFLVKMSTKVVFGNSKPVLWGKQKVKTKPSCEPRLRVDTKWRFKFFAKYNYSFLVDVIIAIIATFSLKWKSLFHDYRYIFRITIIANIFIPLACSVVFYKSNFASFAKIITFAKHKNHENLILRNSRNSRKFRETRKHFRECKRACGLGSQCRPNECLFQVWETLGVGISGRGPDGQVRELQGSVYEQPKGEVDGSCHS